MSSFRTLLCSSLLIGSQLVSGCASQSGQIDYQTETDFSQLTSFTVRAADQQASPLIAQRIDQAVTAHLQQRGWSTDTGAATELFYRSQVGEVSKEPSFRIGIGVGSIGSRGGISGGASVPVGERVQQQLTITLDVVAEGKLVWRGEDAITLATDESPTERTADISKLVDQLLSQFPPTP
ncbi:DUF4136 domain-containing protein [Ferrimonas senticii]|uniref:DUF4136 domain-containing protein n=1 Tax=Ferrimonas senticii TaxID=394566 RepID=UPI0004052058|nr:DUF4136 domain-containing protein [Ferrimonas senticii]